MERSADFSVRPAPAPAASMAARIRCHSASAVGGHLLQVRERGGVGAAVGEEAAGRASREGAVGAHAERGVDLGAGGGIEAGAVVVGLGERGGPGGGIGDGGDPVGHARCGRGVYPRPARSIPKNL